MSTIHLSFLYYQYLLRKKSFVYCVLLLVVLGLLLVPDSSADYVTFYIGKISPSPNKFWIGNLCAIFSNVIISFLAMHLIYGEREKEILNFTYIQYDISFKTSFSKALYKILGMFGICLTFLLILNITIFIQNFGTINLIYFVLPLVYFSFPFLFFVSVASYFFEFYIKNNVLKLIFYYAFIIVLIFNDNHFGSVLGISELNALISENISEINNFAIGYLPKSKIEIIYLVSPIIPVLWFKKVALILVSLLIAYFLSKKTINRKISEINTIKGSPPSLVDSEILFDPSSNKIKKSWSFLNLLYKDFYLFSNCCSRISILSIFILWSLSIVVRNEFFNFLLPLMFLFTLFTNTFLNKLSFYNIQYFEKISPYKSWEIFFSKSLIIYLFYILLLVPLFLKFSLIDSFSVILYFLILTIVQVGTSILFKNSTIINILFIIIFATYLTGKPILNIFLL